MAQQRNVFVCFEQLRPNRGDDEIREVVESISVSWDRISKNILYLHGDLDAQAVGDKVWTAMQLDDKLMVIDSTRSDARWYNVKPEISQFPVNNWHA